MPLDADDGETPMDEGFNGAVEVPGDCDEPRSELFHRLMMETVHCNRLIERKQMIGEGFEFVS